MFQNSQTNALSPEYSEFTQVFNKFLNHYTQASQLFEVFKTLKGRNTQVLLLYTRAVEAHIAATNAYLDVVAIYTSFAEKMLEQCPRARL